MEQCEKCLEYDEDRRTLRMECFYDMGELRIPLDKQSMKYIDHDDEVAFYTIRVCKRCRADWMLSIQKWFQEKPFDESCGSGIYVRVFGDNRQITDEQWNEMNPGIEPCRFKE